ncbi:PspA/IM30 family protein [Rapidithrix thailandica]|uniref:PspA/IM30 family protein n=1 Tax=Rapidithrix thailandica TaxID=413964 RepID=A0AAW9SEX7_9BACT
MFGWLKRLFGIGAAEANAALNKLEDPVKMTEQGIRDLKNDLAKSLQGLAEVKAMAIRAKKELEASHRAALEYENKAVLLLQKANKGEIAQTEADRLAEQALSKKEQILSRVKGSEKNVAHYDQMVGKMEGNVQKLKQQISSWEGELKTLKARSTVSKATAKLNKQLASVDSSDTLARLERMKEKVAEEEALAESYADIAGQATSIDDEINNALGADASTSQSNLPNSEALKQLKARVASENQSDNTSSESNSTEHSNTPPPSSSLELEKLKQKLKDSNNN